VIHVVNLQGSISTDGCYVNLGVHLSFIHTAGGGECSPTTIKEYECAFRQRLDPPKMTSPRWPYGANQVDAEAVVERMRAAWKAQGMAFFSRYGSYPDDFAHEVETAVTNPPHPGLALTYAQLAAHLGMATAAVAIAKQAIDAMDAMDASAPAARDLRAHLGKVLGH
jgi:hypothetical protein